MKVILLEEVKGKGGEGDIVEVAHGFAINYLLPRGMAVEATKGNLKQLEARKGNIAKRELARTTDANTICEAIDGKKVVIPAKVGEEGQLFGSVTNAAIADAITEQLGVSIDRKKIELGKAIKEIGAHEVTVAIYRDVKAALDVEVVDEAASEEEAPVEVVITDVIEETADGEVVEEVIEEVIEPEGETTAE